MTDKTGGPAFPIEVNSEMTCLGMTLRDYFAAKAMQGILSGLSSNKEMAMLAQNAWHKKGQTDYEYVCEQAHKYADAMLKAREQ